MMYLTPALKKSFGLIFKGKIGKETIHLPLIVIGIAGITTLLLGFGQVWFASQPSPLVNVSLVKGHRIAVTEVSTYYSADLAGYKNIIVTGKATGDIVESYLILFRHDDIGFFRQKVVAAVNSDGIFQARYSVPEKLKSGLGWMVMWSIKDGKVVATSSGNFRNLARH